MNYGQCMFGVNFRHITSRLHVLTNGPIFSAPSWILARISTSHKHTFDIPTGAYSEGGYGGWNPPELWFSWFLLDLCWCHEHNGSYRPSWSKTCSRMHQDAPFRRRKCQNPSPDPTPVDAFGASIRVPSALDPPRPHFWIRACIPNTFSSL